LVLLNSGTLLSACTVGPDYKRPALPSATAYSPQRLPTETVSAQGPFGAAQRISIESEIQADWWTLFNSSELNDFIERAFAASPTIESARAALGVAQENVQAQRGFFFPTIQAGYKPTRTKIAANLGGNSPGVQGDGSVISTSQGPPASAGGSAPFNAPVIYNFHTAQLTVGFIPDVFGGNRRQVEGLEAQARSQRFQLEAALLTLASNVVGSAVQDAVLRRQIEIVQEMVADDVTAVALARRQVDAGHSSRLDLANQEAALAQVSAMLPALVKQLEQNRDLLRLLVGSTQDQEIPFFDLDTLRLPEVLPLSLPSRLVAQRPDVRAAEALLQAASAQIGVARAARLPQFTIDASAGGAASRLTQAFWNSGQFFNLALGVTQPLFDGGTLLHREAAAKEAYLQAAADYRSTVLVGFQNMADVLHAIDTDAAALRATVDSAETARSVLELTRRQHAAGYLDRLALIAATQNSRQARINLVQAQGARLGDCAALFHALGGGWWRNQSN